MTHDEILQGLYDDTLVGNAPSVRELTERWVDYTLLATALCTALAAASPFLRPHLQNA